MSELENIYNELFTPEYLIRFGYFINVNLKMYKSGNLKMYNFTHSIHPSIGKIHP